MLSLFKITSADAQLREHLEELRKKTPIPVFWLFGKTQSGKTSIIRYLTGAEDAEIGQGFQPCTRFSRKYEFPTVETPLIKFLDTRGLDEPNYNPIEDLQLFDTEAHVLVVTVRVLDQATENVIRHLRTIRSRQTSRPVLLVLTTLHEAYPQEQHPSPYPFTAGTPHEAVPEPLRRAIDEQRRRFEGLFDYLVPLDLTPAAEGFNEPDYGGQALKDTLIQALPHAYRQTLIHLESATGTLQDLYSRHALPYILSYSTMAATAGAVPIPWVDLLLLPGIQTRMIYHLARLYHQPMNGQRFLELAGSLGLGMVMRQALREFVKFIPFVGSVSAAVLAGAATFALGKAFCYYLSAVHKGHVPKTEELKAYYHAQLAEAEKHWRLTTAPPPTPAPDPAKPAREPA